MKNVILAELVTFLLFVGFVLIEEPAIIGVYLLALGGLGYYMKKKQPAKLEALEQDFADNMGTAGLTFFVLSLILPFAIMGDSYWLQVLAFATINGMMALGLNFMTGHAGLICLGYAGFMAIGAYTVGILTLKCGFSFWLALPIAGILASLSGVLMGLPALRVKGHYLGLVTIAFGLVVQELILNADDLTGGPDGLINIPSPMIGAFDLGQPIDLGFMNMPYVFNFYILGVILMAISAWIVYKLSNSFFGLSLNAMREDELAAQCYGMNITSYKLYAFGAGAFFGGIAGGMYASMMNFIAPENFNYGLSIIVISMVILGGMDSIPGAIVGAILLTCFPEKFRAFEDFRVMFYGFIIVFCLLFMREGLLPFKHRIFKLGKKEAE